MTTSKERGFVYSFYSKKTNNKLIEIEYFTNTVVYWTFDPAKEDEKLFNEMGYSGMDEVPMTTGNEIVNRLKTFRRLQF